ncbi:hypothetical protein [Paenibacillus sp. Root444D2]|uniref:hypothetical protein n=1 Tax=Paenibacillus sp. Root444D2 TaxID=1736538 RepID=UPI00070B713B|nr:hypothetical protein [Paenibacillus sp. Root444D2]KQX46868.1 hypothetical protein ASD40_16445 [Paenibacillus sp. Root444D2]
MDIPFIIFITLVACLIGSIDIKHKTFNIITFLKTLLSVGIFVVIIAFISDKYLPKASNDVLGVWILGGTILVLSIYLTIRAFVQLKKK